MPHKHIPKRNTHTNTISPPPTKTKITGTSNHRSLSSLNINRLNLPTERHRLKDWIQKQNPFFCCIQEANHNFKDRYYLKVTGWGKIFQSNGLRKKAGAVILISK